MSKKYLMHLISGTHWDREWRLSAEQSKLRLTELIDAVLDVLERKPSFHSFCLDGGSIVIEDYLTVRPENRARIENLVRAGRIMLVGWYTLPDTFTVAPEALIRNMLLGQRMSAGVGGAMASGYSAFSYGQTSQLPQIYRGFGIETAMFYRGTNQFELPPLFVWEGKDGSRLHTVRTFDDVTRTNWFFGPHYRLILNKNFRDARYHYDREERPAHLCDATLYEKAFQKLRESNRFKDDEESLCAAVDAIRAQAEPAAIGRHLLALNLQDNAWPYEPLPEMIAAMNAVAPDIEIVQNSFDEYFTQILTEHRNDDLFVHHGELRYAGVAPGLTGLYGATHSSRVKLKVLNDEAETWLLSQAEPLASTAAMLGVEYPTAMLNRAWRYLLQNHAHDSICGAAVDQAHEDMLYRFSVATTVAQEVAARSVTALFDRIDTQSAFDENDHVVTVFNTMPVARHEVIPLVIDLPAVDREPSPSDPCTGLARYDKEIRHFDFVDAEGNTLEHEVLSRDTIWLGVDSMWDSQSVEMRTIRRRVLLHAEVPPMGYATFALRPREPRLIKHPAPGPNRPLIARQDGTLENEYLRVTIHTNGTFSLLNKATGRRFESLHYFTDSGETGSAHRSNTPQDNPVMTSHGSKATLIMEESSLLRGVYRIGLEILVPDAASANARRRSAGLVSLPICTWLTLDKGSRHLKVRTVIHNSARDHKLQVHFPTGLKTDTVAVESAFAVEERDIRWAATADNSENWFMFHPMQNFVDMSDGKEGLAFLSRGLREYETQDDADRTLSITLLRTHRAYMKPTANMTPEELDRYTGLQGIGAQEYRYALYPHAGDWREGAVHIEAYRHKSDLRAILGVPNKGPLPPSASFLNIDPADQIMISAFKRSEDGSGYVLRLWNISGDTVPAEITFSLPVKSVRRLRMDETPQEDIPLTASSLSLTLGPHKIETLWLGVE